MVLCRLSEIPKLAVTVADSWSFQKCLAQVNVQHSTKKPKAFFRIIGEDQEKQNPGLF